MPLRRLVAEPRLVVDPVLDFGAVIPSITTVKEIQLRNTGGSRAPGCPRRACARLRAPCVVPRRASCCADEPPLSPAGTRPAVFSADFDPVDGTTCSVNPPTGTLQPGRSMALVVSLAAEKEMTIGIPIRVTAHALPRRAPASPLHSLLLGHADTPAGSSASRPIFPPRAARPPRSSPRAAPTRQTSSSLPSRSRPGSSPRSSTSSSPRAPAAPPAARWTSGTPTPACRRRSSSRCPTMARAPCHSASCSRWSPRRRA